MNLSLKTSLSLLFVFFGAMPAAAAMSGDDGLNGDSSIETVADSACLRPLDRLLGGGNHSGLFESVLKQHAGSALHATGVMEGHFERAGADHPVRFGQLGPSDRTMPPAPVSSPARAPNLSLTVAAHNGGHGRGGAASASGASSGSSAAGGSIAPTGTNTLDPSAAPDPPTPPASPVPLPATAFLLASGLVGLPVMRRLRQN